MQKQYTKFSNNLQSRLPKQWLARPFPITNIIFDPRNENIIIMHDDSTVYIIDKLNEFSEKETKILKRENGDLNEDSNSFISWQSQQVFQVLKKYKVILIILLCNFNLYRNDYYCFIFYSILYT